MVKPIEIKEDHVNQLLQRGLIKEITVDVLAIPNVKSTLVDRILDFKNFGSTFIGRIFEGLSAEVRYKKGVESLARKYGCDAYLLEVDLMDAIDDSEFPYRPHFYQLEN